MLTNFKTGVGGGGGGQVACQKKHLYVRKTSNTDQSTVSPLLFTYWLIFASYEEIAKMQRRKEIFGVKLTGKEPKKLTSMDISVSPILSSFYPFLYFSPCRRALCKSDLTSPPPPAFVKVLENAGKTYPLMPLMTHLFLTGKYL
jgi:hypothetical protein